MNETPAVTAPEIAAAPVAAATEAAASVQAAATETVQAATAAAPTVTATEIQCTDCGAPAPGATPPPKQDGMTMMLMMFGIFALFYFMMIRPQNRKEKERRKMIEELRAGAKVIFAGGIIGTIVEANEKTFIIETADGKMEVLRSSVQGVVEEK